MKKIIFIFLVIIGLTSIWHFNLRKEPVESIEEVIGKDYKDVYSRQPNSYREININKSLFEIDNSVLLKQTLLKDSIVRVYTFEYLNYKETVWVGKTANSDEEIIDAIRYDNDVRF